MCYRKGLTSMKISVANAMAAAATSRSTTRPAGEAEDFFGAAAVGRKALAGCGLLAAVLLGAV